MVVLALKTLNEFNSEKAQHIDQEIAFSGYFVAKDDTRTKKLIGYLNKAWFGVKTRKEEICIEIIVKAIQNQEDSGEKTLYAPEFAD